MKKGKKSSKKGEKTSKMYLKQNIYIKILIESPFRYNSCKTARKKTIG